MFITRQTPKGTKDQLPEETRKTNVIKNKLLRIFRTWGYKQITTPTVEFVDVFSANLGSNLINQMFKFQDFTGELLALRPEITIPIVRLATTRFSQMVNPLRLSYVSNVFRYSQSYTEREREFWQAGVELLAPIDQELDGEILALLITILLELGFTSFRIDLGYKDLLKEIIAKMDLAEIEQELVQQMILTRNKEAITNVLENSGLPEESIKALIALVSCQKLSSIMKVKVPQSFGLERIWAKLQAIKKILDCYNYTEFVFFDITLTKEIDYYTGLIVEVSVPEQGLLIGGGGRYDKLLQAFAREDLGGIGFALEIDKCLTVLECQNPALLQNKNMVVLIQTKNRLQGELLAKLLRRLGIITIVEESQADDDYKRENELNDFDFIITLNDEENKELKVFNTATNEVECFPIQEIVKIVEGRE